MALVAARARAMRNHAPRAATTDLASRLVLYTSPQDNGGGLWPYFWPQLQTGAALGRAAYLSLRYSVN